MTTQPLIYLASASPRRGTLLHQLGISHERLIVTVDEMPQPGENAADCVVRLALSKARAGWHALDGRSPRPVLGADTDVVIDGTILGKPRDRQEACAMLDTLSGREHQVFSAVALVADTRQRFKLQESRVRFRQISPDECLAYWRTGEPADKAGGYAIQGQGAAFVAELKGSYSGVMGLPLFETAELLREFDIPIF